MSVAASGVSVAAVGTFDLDVGLHFVAFVRLVAFVHCFFGAFARHSHAAHGQYTGHQQHRQSFFQYAFHVHHIDFQLDVACGNYPAIVAKIEKYFNVCKFLELL